MVFPYRIRIAVLFIQSGGEAATSKYGCRDTALRTQPHQRIMTWVPSSIQMES